MICYMPVGEEKALQGREGGGRGRGGGGERKRGIG